MRILYVYQSTPGGFSAPSVHVREVVSALRELGQEVETWGSPSPGGRPFAQAFLNWRWAQGFRFPTEGIFDWVYHREQAFNPFLARAVHRLGCRYAVEINGLLVEELRREKARCWDVGLAHLTQGSCLKTADAVFASSSGWAGMLARRYRLDRAKITYVRNGAAMERFRPIAQAQARRAVSLDPGALVLGFVGSIYRYYDFEPVLSAARRLREEFPNLLIVLAGGGPRAQALQQRCLELGLGEVVQCPGVVPHDTVPDWIGSFDACLLPVRHEIFLETGGVDFAMKLAEYAACGRPIIKYDRPESESFAGQQDFTWSYSEASQAYSVLREALVSAEERQRRGENARAYAERHLSWKQSAHVILDRLARP